MAFLRFTPRMRPVYFILLIFGVVYVNECYHRETENRQSVLVPERAKQIEKNISVVEADGDPEVEETCITSNEYREIQIDDERVGETKHSNSAKDENGDSEGERSSITSSCSIASLFPPPNMTHSGTSESELSSINTPEISGVPDDLFAVDTQYDASAPTSELSLFKRGPKSKARKQAENLPASSEATELANSTLPAAEVCTSSKKNKVKKILSRIAAALKPGKSSHRKASNSVYGHTI